MRYAAGRLLYNGRKNVLWGAGEKGIDTLFRLASIGISIEMFCDSNSEKWDSLLYNKPVISPEAVLQQADKYNIVVAVEKAEYICEIIGQLRRYGFDSYITWEDIGSIDCPISIHKSLIDGIIHDVHGKGIILYGDAKKHEIQVLKEMLSALGVRVLYLADDIEEEYEWMGSSVKPVYDLFYDRKEHKLIMVSDKEERQKRLNRLDEIGLAIHRDYWIYDIYAEDYPKTFVMDVQLGYNFFNRDMDTDMPGFQKSGEEGAYKIVLLGGSTTDATLYPFKSWGDFLYERFCENGYKVQIINGGCAGYSSAQELIKLIRDVIPMRPGIVINYTGVNDLSKGVAGYPFISAYHKELFEAISRSARIRIDSSSLLKSCSAEYTLGVRNDWPVWKQFVDNIRIMRIVCQEFGILHYAFLQPHLTLKRGKYSIYEMDLEKKNARINQEYIEGMDTFYEYVKREGKDYIEDITALFDEVGDVYMDSCHVTEKGNEIIGRFMYDYLIGQEGISI